MSAIPSYFSSPSAIRAHALTREDGNGAKWFERGAMRFFSTRLLRGVWPSWDGKYYFVTSDARGPRAEYGRGYTVRTYDPRTNDVETLGGSSDGFNAYSSSRAARSAAMKAARATPAPTEQAAQ